MLKSHDSSTPSKWRLAMHLGSFRARLTVLVGAFLVAGLAGPVWAEASWRPLGEELAVNQNTYNDQFRPAAASDGAGHVLVAWTDRGLSRMGIKGRIYDASGQPVTQEFLVGGGSPGFDFDFFYGRPRVAALGTGEFVVVWTGLYGNGVRFRFFNALGQPLSDPIRVYDGEGPVFSADVAADPAGGFVLTWLAASFENSILAQRFDASGAPRAGAFPVSSSQRQQWQYQPRVAVDPVSGEFLISWIDERESGNPDVWARRFTPSGQPRGAEFLVSASKEGQALGAVPVFHAGGSSVVWTNFDEVTSELKVVAQRFDATAGRVGSETTLQVDADFYADPEPAVIVAPGRGLLVLWTGPDQRGPDVAVLGRLFDDQWRPASELFQVNTYVQWSQREPTVTADAHGNFMAFWSSGEDPYPASPQPDTFRGQDGSSFGVYSQRFALAGCAPGDDHLCLGNRFVVRATWKNPYTGETGAAHGHPLTDDTGALWFFDPANLELMVKVLDGRAVNSSFWVFYGALSNVEYTLTVTDTQTGAERTYHNAPLQLASRADISAFPDSGASLAAKAAVPAVTRAGEEIVGKASCAPSATALCLGSGRFAVEVVWTDPRTGLSAQGRALPLTADTGAFWFLDAANLELMIKVLDGRAVNGRFWVFYGALSDLDYTITVTDRETGARRTYHNDRHQLASRADTAAF
jgi:hypothetical protein